MTRQDFKVSFHSDRHGHSFPVLTAQQFPYPNLQVVPLADQDRNRILARLRKECGGFRIAEGRDDYAVILAGGTSDEHPPVVITQENHKEIDNALLDAMQRGADWWNVFGKDCLEEREK